MQACKNNVNNVNKNNCFYIVLQSLHCLEIYPGLRSLEQADGAKWWWRTHCCCGILDNYVEMHPSDTSIEMHPCEHAFASPVSASHHRPFRLRIGVLKHFEGVLKLLQLLKLYYRKFRCMVATKILNRKGCDKGCDIPGIFPRDAIPKKKWAEIHPLYILF